ncbi:apoptosis regulatory protein Siva-like [Brienomyrus brachyistius]|uniref:apoptosis regulatory protein Siva-like n=1 Tax=Brienomyrus brachyistius TaxID=42636 RepID=UPI0020B2069B|nr:apoptosis regulatory protein Siva-like [Brienomyrus brachyistius]XP_048884269.1 apoptosis regulatory protein Siva-like [Brienomyrus brachyistius]XP_048884270.1 apoptosis regulatory protein Siva-like [Brienomyrus brachyistius]XP_048884272.1 apoptosis regulatory protein Siva-like [Brienomyrus brachyistius]XP_048884273.1 apoptosis regulatory protein Siva-like [Brienomyrus brachyistius]
MSKRCCPWSDGTPQRKTCVKDGAVAGEAERKAVYEHTRALLFSGARSLQLSPTPTVSSSPSARRGTARGQMRIGSRGELLQSPENAGDPPSSPACTLCERPLQASDSCVRCEKVVCVQCQRRCSLCLRTHCFICCQPNYNERYERMTCIHCLTE